MGDEAVGAGSQMLRVVGTEEARAPRLVFGEYIPLDIEWEEPAQGRIYWRGGDRRWAVLEVGLRAESGRIVSISVVTAGLQLEFPSEPLPEPVHPPERGLPIFDLTPLTGRRYLDVESPYTFVVRPDSISIRFAPPEEGASDLDCLPVRFHLSAAREVLGFSVLGLGEAETNHVKDLVTSSRETAGTQLLPAPARKQRGRFWPWR